MSFVPYNRDIPFATNSPSQDQPDMQENTNSTDDILQIDHYSFNDALGGLHVQTTLPTLGPDATLPSNTAANRGSVFTNTVTRSALNTTELFYTPDASANSYQLTQAVNASFARFATNTNYVAPVTTLGGWTFLPGGMILQYGIIVPTNLPGTTTVRFPIPFAVPPFSIQITATVSNSSGDQTAAIRAGSVSTTQFLASTSSSGTVQNFYWMAIGN